MQKPKTAFTFLLHSIKPFKFYVGLHLFVVLYNAIDLSLWPYVSKILVDKLAATPHENIISTIWPTRATANWVNPFARINLAPR
jgi:hypothetical protein